MIRLVASVTTVVLVMAFFVITVFSRPVVGAAEKTASSQSAWTLTDAAGRSHTIMRPATRLAACSSFALETLMALGVEPVVRFEVLPVYPPSAEKIPVVARSHSTGPDVEMLVAARPDAILLHRVFASFADAVQQTTGVPVILHEVKSLDDVRSNLAMLGRLTGKQDEAGCRTG